MGNLKCQIEPSTQQLSIRLNNYLNSGGLQLLSEKVTHHLEITSHHMCEKCPSPARTQARRR